MVAIDALNKEESAPELTFAFGDTRNPKVDEQLFRVPEGLPRPAVTYGIPTDLLDTDSGKTVSRYRPEAVIVYPRVDPRWIRLRVCVDPQGPTELQPGSYSGAVVMSAPRVRGVKATAVEVTLSVRDAQEGFAIGAAY